MGTRTPLVGDERLQVRKIAVEGDARRLVAHEHRPVAHRALVVLVRRLRRQQQRERRPACTNFELPIQSIIIKAINQFIK